MSTLGDRMRNYEDVNRNYLTARLPVILRLDGKNFSNYTKGFKHPYDERFLEAMRRTAKNLCENVEGCKFAYTQSDEISLLLVSYRNLDTQGWFANNIQKMVSVAASMAAIYFYRNMWDVIDEYAAHSDDYEYIDKINNILDTKYATFDCRCFVLPKEEVVNYFWWRQLDCNRNAVMSVAREYYSSKELMNKRTADKLNMMAQDEGINWEEDFPCFFRRGTGIYKDYFTIFGADQTDCLRSKWLFDMNLPLFVHDREYLEKFI